jgi:hypothetical protein
LFRFKKSCLKSKIIKGIKGTIKSKIPKNTSLSLGFLGAMKKENIIIGTNETGTRWILEIKPAKSMARGKLNLLLTAW